MSLNAQSSAGPRPNARPPFALPTEFALAVECCRAGFAGLDMARGEELAESTDWAAFLTIVRRHRIEALAWQAVRLLNPPDRVADELAADARRISEQGLRSAAECRDLQRSFEKAGIEVLFVKGLTLGKLAYGNPFVKMGWDIDLLIDPATVGAAAEALVASGYSLLMPERPERLARWHEARKESAWRNRGGVVVELHSRLADSDRLIPGITTASPRREVEIAPGVRLPTLAAEDLFAYLCVHGASSAWFRLKWISDLAGLLEDCGAGETERLYLRSQELGAGRAAAQALVLIAWLFGSPAPALTARLDRGTNRWLAKRALKQLLAVQEPTRRPLGTVTIHASQFALLPGGDFKLAEFRRQFRDAAEIY